MPTYKESEADDRDPLDLIHFGISFAGFIVAVGGVVISSLAVAVGGLALLLIGLAYFSMADASGD